MKLTQKKIDLFRTTIWDFYEREGRSFAWRHVSDPYKVLVSEVMLQQTQTSRVIEKFDQWLKRFPSVVVLANASLFDVLQVWQGLGYNRRGKYLHEIAKKIVEEYNGVLPCDPKVLITFPGIGPATAASICAFAFNSPTVFIETNIRTVFIYYFFQRSDAVHDSDIEFLVSETLDRTRPRDWYYALMDYGVMLKKKMKVSNTKSVHYTKQSRFQGSDRQIRGKIIKILTKTKKLQLSDLINQEGFEFDRATRIVDDLSNEGLIMIKKGKIFIE